MKSSKCREIWGNRLPGRVEARSPSRSPRTLDMVYLRPEWFISRGNSVHFPFRKTEFSSFGIAPFLYWVI